MSIWRTLKATVVGIHADYHTGFERLREKFQPQPEPAAIGASSAQELYGFAKDYDEYGIRSKPKHITSSPEPYQGVWSSFFTSTGPPTKILSQLEGRGWSNLVVLPGTSEGLCVQGNHYDEYGTYEASVNSVGDVSSVRTIEAVTEFEPFEVPDDL